MAHPPELRNKVLKTLYDNPSLSNRDIAKMYNISHRAVNLWVSKSQEMPMSYKNRPNKDLKWTSKQKLEAVFKFDTLNDLEKGAFLREYGIYSEQLDRWKQEMLNGLEHPKTATDKEIKLLKKEVNEKKVLLELQKKVQHLLKDEDKS